MIVFHDIVQNTTLHHEAEKIAVPMFWNEIKKRFKYKEIIEDPAQASMGMGILFV